MKNVITVQTVVNSPIERVWECWNEPKHITGWAFATNDWEVPTASNNLHIGGKFRITTAAKDKSASFTYTGVYTNIKEYELIEYDMDDGRHVKVEFKELAKEIKITEKFEPEDENPAKIQRSGWQSTLENFKKYVEAYEEG